MKVSELITALAAIQNEHGDVPVLMDGWNDCGHVEVDSVSTDCCRRTDAADDGEIIRRHVLSDGSFDAGSDGAFVVAVVRHGASS